MIGLDTSHVEIFTKLLSENPYIYSNARVTIGCPSPSLDMDLSKNRVEEYTALLSNSYNVTITNSIKEVAEQADAIMITSVDGRKHLDVFRQIVFYQKPTFIDKPLAITGEEVEEIFELSKKYNTPIMSSSSLRYADSLQKLLQKKNERPKGVYLSGPLPFIEKMPYYYWYGIHMIEMLITIMEPNYKTISIQGNDNFDVITTEWEDGRFGIIHGDHNWHGNFEAIIHYENETIHLPVYKDEKPFYACLLEQVVPFFKTGISPIDKKETVAVMSFVEAASKIRGRIQ